MSLQIKKIIHSLPKPSTIQSSYILLILAQLMVAVNVVGSKMVVSHTSLIAAIFLRFLFATIILSLIYYWQGDCQRAHFQLPKKHWILLILQGLCAGAFFNLFIMLGVNYTSASMAGMLISLLPAVIAISAMIFLKERLSRFQKIGIILAMVGLFFINQNPTATTSHINHFKQLLGVCFLLMALVPETAYYLLSKAYQFELPILVFASLLNGVNVLSLLPVLLLNEPNFFSRIDTFSFEVLFGTGVASALFYIFWSQGIKEISATRAGMLTALCPLMTLLIAALFLGESINFHQMIGMFFVILSVLLSNKKAKSEVS